MKPSIFIGILAAAVLIFAAAVVGYHKGYDTGYRMCRAQSAAEQSAAELEKKVEELRRLEGGTTGGTVQ